MRTRSDESLDQAKCGFITYSSSPYNAEDRSGIVVKVVARENCDVSIDTDASEDEGKENEDEGKETDDEVADDSATMSMIEMRVCIQVFLNSCPCYLRPLLSSK